MKIADIVLKQQAFAPAARSAADTKYNGTATLANAVGIPTVGAGRSIFELSMGDISASITSITCSIHASAKQTGNLEADLTALENAVATIVPADANKIVAGSVNHTNIPLTEANEVVPQYLFVKAVQVGAYAANYGINAIQVEHPAQPQNIVAAADLRFDI